MSAMSPTDLLVSEDLNQTGNVKYFNQQAANFAVNATNASFGCPNGAAGVNCAIARVRRLGTMPRTVWIRRPILVVLAPQQSPAVSRTRSAALSAA